MKLKSKSKFFRNNSLKFLKIKGIALKCFVKKINRLIIKEKNC